MDMTQLWMAIRYLLIFGGAYLASKGYINKDDVTPFVDGLIQIGGGVMALGSMAWGFYVRWKTVIVPRHMAMRRGVPIVSPATGSVQE